MTVPAETPRCPEDVAVAHAALAGDPAALRALDQHFADVRVALRGVVPDHEIDELVQEVRIKIVVDRKLESYTGKGPLRAWLRVALLRAGLDRRRVAGSRANDVPLDDVAWLAHAADGDPALAAVRGTLGPVVRRALEAALTRLDARERLILRQHLVDGLSAPDLASLHGVHRVTAFRWLATIRQRVLHDVRATVARELSIGGESLASLMRELRASAAPSVERLLIASEPR
jgi:RNA polymerase sigma-70 factor (ECF subfamily)